MKTTTRTALAGTALLALTLLTGQAAHAQTTPCRFQLGFADLARLLGDRAGTCREDQRLMPNGDAQQRTTRGLMVWRKADNWTAFTDGGHTWINGPNGLEVRLNTERFPWEPDAGAAGRPIAGVHPPEPEPTVPGTQLGVPIAGQTLTLTVLSFAWADPGWDGARWVKATVKVEHGTSRASEFDSWDFYLRSPEGVEYRASALGPGRPGGLGRGQLPRGQWVVGDLWFEVPANGGGYGLHFYPQGHRQANLAISRWLGGPA
jgi:hypothetical protein